MADHPIKCLKIIPIFSSSHPLLPLRIHLAAPGVSSLAPVLALLHLTHHDPPPGDAEWCHDESIAAYVGGGRAGRRTIASSLRPVDVRAGKEWPPPRPFSKRRMPSPKPFIGETRDRWRHTPRNPGARERLQAGPGGTSTPRERVIFRKKEAILGIATAGYNRILPASAASYPAITAPGIAFITRHYRVFQLPRQASRPVS